MSSMRHGRGALLLLVITAVSTPALAQVRFVDRDAGGAGDGSSWANAYTHLQQALLDAANVGGFTEIWVAAGTYTPTTTLTRSVSFVLTDGVTLRGGFAGGETHVTERAPAGPPTILSGDIGVPGVSSDNTYHVIDASAAGASTIIDRVTIAGGNANSVEPFNRGGAVLIEAAAGQCQFVDCRFLGNAAIDHGGAVYVSYGAPAFLSCEFSGNRSGGDGGALFTAGGPTRVSQCTIGGNDSLGGVGGGIATTEFVGAACAPPVERNLAVVNSVLWGNTDSTGDVLSAQLSSNAVVCSEESPQGVTPLIIAFCCLQGWDGVVGGPTNRGDDPRFRDLDGPDDVPGTIDDDLRLGQGTGCADAGDNAAIPADVADLDGDNDTVEPVDRDLDGGPRIIEAIVDLGAYELLPDCNTNGVLDRLDISGGTSLDCDSNDFPDECDILAGDCNVNGIPDACDLVSGASGDCNSNGVSDDCDILGGLTPDLDNNGVPDECEIDCNSNGVRDDLDLAGGTSRDCDGTGHPDECELANRDCNTNGIPDECDIAADSGVDCNANNLPDTCDIAAGAPDCDLNGRIDDCDIALTHQFDCNGNGVPDRCDLAAGTATDCNANDFPDACEDARRFFILDNAADVVSRVLRFDPITGATERVLDLPDPGNDRGMTAMLLRGELMICDFDNQRLHLVNIFARAIIQTATIDRPILELAYAPTSRRLYGTSPTGTLFRIDLVSGNTIPVMDLPGESVNNWVAMTFDPFTGQLIGASLTERRLHYLDPITQAGIPAASTFSSSLADLVVDPVDGTIYGVTSAGQWHRVNRATGSSIAISELVGLQHTAAGLCAFGTTDCDLDNVQDDCAIAAGTTTDCNANGRPDTCEIAGGTAVDVDTDGVLDTCADCNANGRLDDVEIAAGSAADCNANAIPDDCERDCNLNGIGDVCEAGRGDFNGDGTVNLADWPGVITCITGPRTPAATPAYSNACCVLADGDLDGDVDLADLRHFLDGAGP